MCGIVGIASASDIRERDSMKIVKIFLTAKIKAEVTAKDY